MLSVFDISLKMSVICWNSILGMYLIITALMSSIYAYWFSYLYFCEWSYHLCWFYIFYFIFSSLEHFFKMICFNLYLFLLTCCYSVFIITRIFFLSIGCNCLITWNILLESSLYFSISSIFSFSFFLSSISSIFSLSFFLSSFSLSLWLVFIILFRSSLLFLSLVASISG